MNEKFLTPEEYFKKKIDAKFPAFLQENYKPIIDGMNAGFYLYREYLRDKEDFEKNIDKR